MRISIVFCITFAAALALGQEAAELVPALVPVDPTLNEIPQWLMQLIMMGDQIPVVGPYIVKGMQWLGLIASVTTTVCACLITILKLIEGVANVANLKPVADKLQEFQNGRIMYYLKFVSLFNARSKK